MGPLVKSRFPLKGPLYDMGPYKGYGRLYLGVDVVQGISNGPLASFKGSGLFAPISKVVSHGFILSLCGSGIRGPYQGTIGSTLDISGSWPALLLPECGKLHTRIIL